MKKNQVLAIWYQERNKEVERRVNFIKENGLLKKYESTNNSLTNVRALGLFLKSNGFKINPIR